MGIRKSWPLHLSGPRQHLDLVCRGSKWPCVCACGMWHVLDMYDCVCLRVCIGVSPSAPPFPFLPTLGISLQERTTAPCIHWGP